MEKQKIKMLQLKSLLDWSHKDVFIVSHNEYKDVLLNYKYLIYSVNWIQYKGHIIGTYEIKTMLLSCFDDKIYIQNNGYVN